MNKDDIARMARESGGLPDPMVFIAAYERFANLVAAAEREECAKVAEQTIGTAGANNLIAYFIRARGKS
jgi:hypothetical protein